MFHIRLAEEEEVEEEEVITPSDYVPFFTRFVKFSYETKIKINLRIKKNKRHID